MEADINVPPGQANLAIDAQAERPVYNGRALALP
jgi:hypothetical protein